MITSTQRQLVKYFETTKPPSGECPIKLNADTRQLSDRERWTLYYAALADLSEVVRIGDDVDAYIADAAMTQGVLHLNVGFLTPGLVRERMGILIDGLGDASAVDGGM
jgi:hypothetical protein